MSAVGQAEVTGPGSALAVGARGGSELSSWPAEMGDGALYRESSL